MPRGTVLCPFHPCGRVYGTNAGLKCHLRTVRGSGYDKVHPASHGEWERLSEFLRIAPRGALYDPEGKRAESQKRHYKKNRTHILEKHRQRRVTLHNTLVGLGKFAHSKLETDSRETLQIRKSIYREIYGDAGKYEREGFINLEGPPTFDTFPRLVVWFLDQSLLPPIHTAIPGVTLMLDVIPGEFHYLQVGAILNQDQNTENGSENLQSRLDSAFELWRAYLETPAHALATVLDNDNSSTDVFDRQGESYEALSEMYSSYLSAYNEALHLLRPQAVSLEKVSRTLMSSQEEEVSEDETTNGTENGKEITKLIETALKVRRNRKAKEVTGN